MEGKQRVNCESCGTSYDRLFLLGKQGNLSVCPMCGASIVITDDGVSSYNNEPSFGDDDATLDDTENFINPDLYYYDIDGAEEQEDLRDIWCQCTSCKTVNRILLSKFDVVEMDHVKLKRDLNLTCRGCGKKIINRIVPRRPDGWRDLKDYTNSVECPICHSTQVHKISMTNKAASAFAFGIFAAGHVSKTYKCDVCGAKF